VLTEPTFFDGSRAPEWPAPPYRRFFEDFIVTEYQLLEAAAAGADATLLIVAALDPERLSMLLHAAHSLGLAALVEVHDADELHAALESGADIVGVNSRNLRTLEVNQSVLSQLGPLIPRDLVAVAESGLRRASDLRQLHALRYDAFLIGERFMTEDEPGIALASLIEGVPRGEVMD
jgi:indole-3-glycerol phosphate synthase